VRHRHGDLGDRRQLAAEILEDPLEHGHDERDQGDQDDQGEAPDEAGVHHRRAHLTPQRVVLLELVGDAHQRAVEDAAGLAGADHRGVELVEDPGVLAQRVRQRDPGFDVPADDDQRLLELVALGLLLEHVERAQQRHARVDHRGELTRGHGQVARLDLLEASEDVARARGLELIDVEDDQPPGAQVLGHRLLVAGVELAVGRDAGEVDGLEREGRHRVRPYAT